MEIESSSLSQIAGTAFYSTYMAFDIKTHHKRIVIKSSLLIWK